MFESAPLPHGTHTGRLRASFTTTSAIVSEYEYTCGHHVEPHAHAAPFVHLVSARRPARKAEPVRHAIEYVGKVGFSPAQDEHSVDTLVDTLNVAIDFLPSFEQRLAEAGADLLHPIGCVDLYSYRLGRQIWDEVQDVDSLTGLEIDCLIEELCENLLLTKKRRISSHGSPYWLRRIVKEVEERYNENLSLEELASHAHMHPSNISRAFRRYSGETLRDYVRRLRVSHARRLVKDGALSLTEIALEVGYWDESHLQKAFKRVTGVTPGHYRRLVRGL